MGILALFTAMLGLAPLSALAQQQAPTQHAPAQKDYVTPSQYLKENRDEGMSSKVTLSWLPIPLATRYLLMIARDGELKNIFYSVETTETTHVTPELPPGQYFYQAQGFQDERAIGKSTLQRFAVGKPLDIMGSEKHVIPPAPVIVGPKHLELFPTYGRVRLSWQAVEGARGYRFRLWNEDKVRENNRWKKDTPPRWITEVKNPWIEVHDAPYTSFMYLESGLYRWDVAAVGKEGNIVGDNAMGYFLVSRQWFLRENDWYFNMQYGFSPHAVYEQSSATKGTSFKLSDVSHRVDGDLDWFFIRQLGVNLGGGIRTFDAVNPHNNGIPNEAFLFYHANFDLVYRLYLSHVPWGWTLLLSGGVGVDEFPQLDTLGPGIGEVHIDRPKAFGPRLGFRIYKRFDTPWELQLRTLATIHALTFASPTGDANTHAPLNAEIKLRTLYNWSNHFATHLEFEYEHKKIMYTPKPFGGQSSVTWANWYVIVGVQLRYFTEEDKIDTRRTTVPQYYQRESRDSQPWRP